MIEPEDDSCGDADGGHEGVGTAVIAGVDASPVLDFGKQVLDQVALFVDRLVVVILHLPVGFWRDAGGDSARGQGGAEPVAVIALVAQQFLGIRVGIEQQNRAFVVAHLTFGQQHHDRATFAIADRILVLHDGIIIRDAAPQEIWLDPKYAAVAKLLGIGNIIEAEVILDNKVKTEFGIFSLTCEHKHAAGEKVSVLVNAKDDGGDEIQLTVEDVLFKRDQFEVKGRGVALSDEAVSKGGLVIHMKDSPKIGQVITVKVQVKCLA